MILRVLSSVVLLSALAGSALADPPVVTVVDPALVPDQLPQQVIGPDIRDVAFCGPLYVNQLAYLAYFNQNGFELLDDLHSQAQGLEALCAYEIGFYNLSGFETTATVTFYDNNAADGAPGAILAGPFRIEGLPVGIVRATYAAPSGVVDADVWMGVRFGAFRATGLMVADPVLVGSSHDLAFSKRYGYVNFGGPPHLPANFVLAFTSQVPVPVQPGTWGAIKAFYR